MSRMARRWDSWTEGLPSVTVTCEACGVDEQIAIIRGEFAGSAFDYCTLCDEPRSEAQQDKVREFIASLRKG